MWSVQIESEKTTGSLFAPWNRLRINFRLRPPCAQCPPPGCFAEKSGSPGSPGPSPEECRNCTHVLNIGPEQTTDSIVTDSVPAPGKGSPP